MGDVWACPVCELRFDASDDPVGTIEGDVHPGECHESLEACDCCGQPGGACPRCHSAHEPAAGEDVGGCTTCAVWSDDLLEKLDAMHMDRRRAVESVQEVREATGATCVVMYAFFEDGTAARLAVSRRDEGGHPDVPEPVLTLARNLMAVAAKVLRAGPGALLVDMGELVRRLAGEAEPEEEDDDGPPKPTPPGGGRWS